MTPDNADKLGRLVDSLDAALYTAKLPIQPQIHFSGMMGKIREARDLCAAIVRDETGEDPWETNPLSG